MSSWEELWLKKFNRKDIPQVNIYPNITVFNRKLYTFGDKNEVFVKFEYIDKSIRSQDELTHLDTRSCVLRVDDNTYIVTVSASATSSEIAVIGKLNARYVNKNNLNQYGVKIQDPLEYKFISLTEIYDGENLTFDELAALATARVKPGFDGYLDDIRNC